ncbi:hypothetical protein PHPALM_18635 [Phytophthora palmivora]|uniref:Uncharacterized protein n=1 Tax=Phytophthora palmivora TaxID=4796 RepID=A0A2P4XJ79_9STRA|nr:hypothetical protein PHPALM_18635 [Phytophthora palmivora]
MEKMIMKNVAASRISTKNRAQQIVEALKKKRQQQEDAPDEAERAAKRKKTSPPHDNVTKSNATSGESCAGQRCESIASIESCTTTQELGGRQPS